MKLKQRLSGLKSLIGESLRGTEQDFTVGSINRGIFLLAIPMMLELALESVFAIVDIFFVAKLGAGAIAVVGLTEALVTVLYAIAIGLSMAVTALIARRIGEHDPANAALVAAQAIWVGLGLSALISVLGCWFAKDLLTLMGASAEIVNTHAGFTQILFGGSSTILFIFLLNGVFRGAGDAAIAMRVLWISNGINIVLDPCLIFGWGFFPEMGVAGAALATTIGRGVGVAIQLYYLFVAPHRIRISPSLMRINVQVIKDILRIARGGIFQFFIETSSWVFLMKIVSMFGATAIAAYTIAIRIVIFTFLPAWGLSNAAATLVGQNLGAQQSKRAEQCVWRVAFCNFLFLSAVAVIFIGYAEPLMGFFTQDPEIVRMGSSCLRWFSYGYGLFGLGLVVIQAYNGAGDTTTPSWINLVAFWLIQIPLAYWLAIVLDIGPTGVFMAVFVGESLMAIVAIKLFIGGKWKTFQV